MPQPRVGEPAQHGPGVALHVEAGRRRGERCHLLERQPLDEAGERRVGHHVGDERQAEQRAEVGDRGVRAVDQPQLQLLVGPHVGDQLRPGRLPGGPAGGEVVLDHPLAEALGGDGRLVPQAEEGRGLVERGRRGGRDDPVDHAAREADPVLDPAGEPRIDRLCELPDEAAQRAAVLRHVVAAEHGEPADARRLPFGEPAHEPAEGRARQALAGEVRPDVGVAGVEIAGRRVVAVALLGDGEGDDPGRRRREPGEQGPALLGRPQRLAQHPDHGRRLLHPVVLDHAVEAVLRPERVAHGGAAQARPADRPRARRVRERTLGQDRLVRAVEGAEAEVDDADLGLERGRGWQRHPGRDVGERAAREPIHPACPDPIVQRER